MIRLYLLRHGEVKSHRGDLPITPDAQRQAYELGAQFGREEKGRVRILSGETARARETAMHLARGLVDAGGDVLGPQVGFALRNPDLYVSGTRVNMVSSAEALAEQVDGLAPGDVAALGFFNEFFASPDRIGWWLRHEDPPGEDAAALAARVRSFMRSLLDPTPEQVEMVIAVTHSPLLRAVGFDLLGEDIGEPPWISGLQVTLSQDGEFAVELFDPEPT